MKFGIHYAYWQHEWAADLTKYCKKVADLGFDVLEISGNALLGMSDSEIKDLSTTAQLCGLVIVPCHGLAKDQDTGSLLKATREKGIDVCKKLFEKMAIANCSQLGGILYSYWPAYDFSSYETDINEARKYSLDSMRVIAAEAAKRNILLTLEVVNRFENFIFNDTRGALDYIDQLDCDNVKLLLDIFHMNIEEDFLGDAIRSAGERLGHFHIGECNRKVPGSGHMPWDDIAQGLKDVNYQGIVTMEPFVRKGGEVAESVRLWRDLVIGDDARLDQDIQTALKFLKEKFN
jgi:D-psicose/D-tagatose/L-ribulose 3-epimerase